MSHFLNFKADRESSYMERRKGRGYDKEKKIVTIYNFKSMLKVISLHMTEKHIFSKKENSYHHI